MVSTANRGLAEKRCSVLSGFQRSYSLASARGFCGEGDGSTNRMKGNL